VCIFFMVKNSSFFLCRLIFIMFWCSQCFNVVICEPFSFKICIF
jgi:hypothetical protein